MAFALFVGVAIGVYLFVGTYMAHFNPVITGGYIVTGHIRLNQIWYYFAAEVIGALLPIVRYLISNEVHLGANSFNRSYPISLLFGIEVLASALLMAVILAVVYTKGLKGFSGIAID
jgi:aquaporin Z